MSSSRLPGKVLLPLAGTPMIRHIYERATLCEHVDKVIIATSTEPSDDKLVSYCKANNLNYFRGDLENVLGRFLSIPDIKSYSYIVRITGDCPLIHPPFIDKQISFLKKYDGDLIWSQTDSPVLQGQGVHSLRSLEFIKNNSNDSADNEHVGSPYISDNPEKFKIVEIKFTEDFLKYNFRLTVDEKKDYELMSSIFNHFGSDTQIDLMKTLEWLTNNNEISMINQSVSHTKTNIELINKRNNWTIAKKVGYEELEKIII